jgi:hypothetical protein
MRVTAITLTLVGPLLAGLLSPLPAQTAQPAPTQGAPAQPVPWHPCAQVRAACEQAGFVRAGAKMGLGIGVDCIRSIMFGAPQWQQAAKALSKIDPQLVAACKERNPDFGMGSGAKSQTSGSPTTNPSGT